MLRTYGVSGLQAHIRNHIQLGKLFHSLIQSRSDLFKLEAPYAFAVTVFSIRPLGSSSSSSSNSHSNGIKSDGVNGSLHLSSAITDGIAKEDDPPVFSHQKQEQEQELVERANAVTKEVYELVNARGEIFITSTLVNGVYAIRIVSANPKAEEKFLRHAFEVLVRTAEEVLQRGGGGGG